MFTSRQIRTLWQEFWEGKQHKLSNPASLVASSEDKTVLFNIAGMQPIVPYLSGKPHPQGTKLYNIQRCLRTNDIDEVGDNTHCTLFEMMGNRSLGDYFKKESLTRSVEFLTEKLGLDFDRLGFTIFGGGDGIECDEEARAILLGLGVDPNNIQEVPVIPGEKCDNFRGPAGPLGPCGPSCELYYDKGDEFGDNDKDFVGNESRYVEIRNNVFMEFYKDAQGNISKLEHKNIDTGMGLERLMTFLQDKPSMYETDLFAPLIDTIQASLDTETPKTQKNDNISYRIIAEHLRSVTFLLADGVIPSNEGRGYVVRRLLRRMRFHYKKLADTVTDGQQSITILVQKVIDEYGFAYPHLVREQTSIMQRRQKEIKQFEKTLKQGQKEFKKQLQTIKNNQNVVSGQLAFLLYDSCGFPLDLTRDMATQYGFTLDEKSFIEQMQAAKKRSKQSSNKKFTKNIDRAAYLDGIPATKFIGYEQYQTEDCKILKDFVVEGQRVVIFDTTPFYAESGGQIGDQGTFTNDKGENQKITDVKKYNGVFLHFVEG